jgi:single-stranded-DNA-specific exonuclease
VADLQDSRWRARPYDYAQAHVLASALGLSHTTASVLVRRGMGDAAAARSFLEADEAHDPARLSGIDAAVTTIMRHVERGSMVAVHGDYDVDGVCSTALLTSALRSLGATVRPRLPSRDEGYGLTRGRVEELHRAGAALLITVDCGITATAEVDLALELGMEMVVTDHHLPGSELPRCPIVHPAVGGYPADLCATGVAFKLAQALWTAAGRDPVELERELDIVALATVADLVPLVGENRTLVRRGLRAIAGAGRPGLRALMRVAGVDPQSVTETTLGFALAPRINAAGRLYRADAGLELILTADEERAMEVARELDAANTERQSVETAILFDAERRLSELDGGRAAGSQAAAHVLDGEGWHPGVIGIVASRLVERYHRPFVLVALDGRGRGRGSGRSISPYDLHAGLSACAQHLIGFGGHRMAAGLEVEADRVEAFRAALVTHAGGTLTAEDLVKEERVDAVVPGDALGLDLAEELGRLRPFGMGNPGVSVLVPAARVSDVQPMSEGRHVRFTVTSGGVRSRAVGFGIGAATAPVLRDTRTRHDLTARLEANEWRGAVEPRLVIRSLHALAPDGEPAGAGCRDCACRRDDGGWWRAAWAAYEQPDPCPPRCARGAERTVVDRRGEGALGVLGDLMTTGEPLLVMCADVSRRAGLLERDLAAQRFGRPPWLRVSSHCAPGALNRVDDSTGAPVLCEYGALEDNAPLPHHFKHVFALDPPTASETFEALRHSVPEGAGFLHLGFGAAEVAFAGSVLAHEHALRPHLAEIYRALSALGPGPAEVTREVLEGDGHHPRSAVVAGRCLRVLDQLSLANLDRSHGTLRCTTTNSGRADLDRSQAFRACARAAEEGHRFLQTLTGETPKARAA